MPSAGDHQEPSDHDRPEQSADTVRAVLLDREDANDDRHGDRDHVGLEQRRGHLEALDRAEHGDRRRDHAVAVEQSGAEDAQEHQPRPGRGRSPSAAAAR